MIKCITTLSILVVFSINLMAQSSPQKELTTYDARLKSIQVPQVKNQKVAVDGAFSPGEWDDALSFPVFDNYDIRMKADSQTLYIGLKAAEPVAIGVCEIRFTENDKDVYLLHVSARLGQGISAFPADTRFEIGNVREWKANLSMTDEIKKDEWIKAGRPMEKYGDVIEKAGGKEFKIQRKMFSGNRIKFTLGLIEITSDGKKTYNYPENADLQNADNWVELVLPEM